MTDSNQLKKNQDVKPPSPPPCGRPSSLSITNLMFVC